MGSRIFLSFVLAGLCVCAGAGAAHAALSARPELKARDGASWLAVTVTSRTGFTARTRPRKVTVVAGHRRLMLRRGGPAPAVWTTARLRGVQGVALYALAGKRVVIEVRTRAGVMKLSRRVPVPSVAPAVPSAPSSPPIVPAPQPPAGGAPAVPKAEQALAIAQRYLGTAYVWGGSTPATGFDSAGLTQYAYAQVGVALPRTTEGQFASGAPVSRESLHLGDLVFFRDTSGSVFHVGLFAGDTRFLHAAHAGDVIKYSSLDEPYYAHQFAGARHIAD